MGIRAEGDQLVIEGFFLKRKYPLCDKLSVDFEKNVISYKGRVIYKLKGLNYLNIMTSCSFDEWHSYLLAKEYLFEWRTDPAIHDTTGYISLSETESYGRRMAELLRGMIEQKAKELLGPQVEVRLTSVVSDTHYVALYDVYQDGVKMCADDENHVGAFTYIDPAEIHMEAREIVMPRYICPGQGIYELCCLPEDDTDIGDFVYELEYMRDKGMVPAEKYRYKEEQWTAYRNQSP